MANSNLGSKGFILASKIESIPVRIQGRNLKQKPRKEFCLPTFSFWLVQLLFSRSLGPPAEGWHITWWARVFYLSEQRKNVSQTCPAGKSDLTNSSVEFPFS